ncbi:hypothetical protein D1007_47628 [Hordeum vulgare]|nr:hypothetical protein D1007_47628 [Hordeum vulgare]
MPLIHQAPKIQQVHGLHIHNHREEAEQERYWLTLDRPPRGVGATGEENGDAVGARAECSSRGSRIWAGRRRRRMRRRSIKEDLTFKMLLFVVADLFVKEDKIGQASSSSHVSLYDFSPIKV